MKLNLLLVALAALVIGMVGTSSAGYFSDTEASRNDKLTAAEQVTITVLNDAFEGTPWTANWDGNGATRWLQVNGGHGGGQAAEAKKNNAGSLISDDLDMSAATMIKVSFWFKPKSLAAGDMLLQLYNGSAYTTWYDIKNYPSYKDNQWCYFSQNITDAQFFKANFRVRFNGAGLIASGRSFDLDDVLVQHKSWP